MKREDITQEMVRELFTYKSGKLFWKKDAGVSAGFKKAGSRAGCPSKRGKKALYRVVGLKGLQFMEHQIIFLYHHGYIPNLIDHIKDTLDKEGTKSNKIENLRSSNKAENSQRGNFLKKKGSKYRGVYKIRNVWKMLLPKVSKTFTNELDASIAYDRKVLELYGDHCFLNHRLKDHKRGGKFFNKKLERKGRKGIFLEEVKKDGSKDSKGRQKII